MAGFVNLQKLFLLFIMSALAVSVMADVPQTINYQGRLTDAAGDPVADGPYLIKFKIYGSPTGTDSLWSSGFQAVTITDGLFDYKLGASISMPANLFTTPARYLGITVGTDAEISPRIQLVSVPYASHSQNADYANLADNAETLAGEGPDFYLNWGDMTNVPAGFADGIDDVGSGDITGVTAGSGLTGGGTSGSVTVAVAANGITAIYIANDAVGSSEIATNAVGSDEIADNAVYSAEIADGAIVDADISNSASISTSKISGTAVNLSSLQTITGTKTFDSQIYRESDYDIPASRVGLKVNLSNSSTGILYGVDCEINHTTAGTVGMDMR